MYDLAQQEWVSGKFQIDVSLKMIMGEKAVGTAKERWSQASRNTPTRNEPLPSLHLQRLVVDKQAILIKG